MTVNSKKYFFGVFFRMSRKTIATLIIIACLLFFSTPAIQAQFHGQTLPYEAQWQIYSVSGNENVTRLAVLSIELDQGWHTYAHNPGDLGLPTTLLAELSPGTGGLEILYPKGKRQADTLNPESKINAYHGIFRIYVPLSGSTSVSVTMKASLEMLLCSATKCMPVGEDIPFQITAKRLSSAAAAEDQPWWPEYASLSSKGHSSAVLPDSFKEGKRKESGMQWQFSPIYFEPGMEVSSLIPALLFGLLAGLILNVMPCVFPVISLKLTNLLSCSSAQECEDRYALFRRHNLFFSFGIMTWFAALALLLGFSDMAWGQVFQIPLVVMTLTVIVFILSLSLFGLFSLPVIDLKLGQSAGNPDAQAFFTGLLATLLATPCSGPFLGGVLGWALVQPASVIITVFASVGIGMSLPYLVLAAFPALSEFLPRPGAWVGIVEKITGLLLVGTCIYLMNILPDGFITPTLILLWVSVPVVWLWGKAGPELSSFRRGMLRFVAVVVLALCTWLVVPGATTSASWTSFNENELAKQVQNGPVLVDFTANWCPTCKVLEKTVLTKVNLDAWKKRYNLTFVKVDMTESNPSGEALLHALGSKSIPLLAFFPSGEKSASPVVIRDLFTTGQLENLLESYTK